MSPDHGSDGLFLMLGEMRGDLKYLVTEFVKQGQRLDSLEDQQSARIAANEARITRLETFRTQIGVVTVALGFAVPTGVTWLAHKLGVL